ncbi:tetraspanin-6-like [Anopheles nili]|uniref:tetraspanin-6-like n=1 Tax=Anopheles nili TaxID=185578 RepID=UPI00237AD2D1|nr:tetraspanin-6-like [Anopheles nili]
MHPTRRALNLIKTLILMLTFLCIVVEIIQIVVGAVLHHMFSTYTAFIDNDFIRATHFLIAVGIVLVFLSIFGIAGIWFENVVMIFMFAGIFGMVVILEVILAVAAFSMYNRVDRMLDRRMRNVIQRFNSDRFMRASFNHMQNEFDCCGITSYDDWQYFHPGQDLPNSCCRQRDEGFCMPHERGCQTPMADFIGSRISMIATGTTIIIVFQVVCIVTAVIMAARLMMHKRQLRANAISGIAPAPSPILTEKPKF